MSRLLLRRKSNIKSNIKPLSIDKIPSTGPSGVEFRWSITAARYALLEEDSSTNFHLININNSPKKSVLFSPSPRSRISTGSRSSCSTQKFSPRLPNINNKKRKTKLSILTDPNNNRQVKRPLLLTYAQLHNAQHHPLQTNKIARTRFSIYPLINTKQTSNPVTNTDVSFSPDSSTSSTISQQQLTTDRYIRLHTPQLRRLHVSEKYMEEAKTLYFNASSRAFLPRLSMGQIS